VLRWAIAFAVGVALLGVTSPPVALAVPGGPAASARSSVDLPQRDLNDTVFRNAKGWLIFKGNVDPGWNHKNVQIYKRLCKGCSWRLVKKARTDGSGRWRTRIYAPRTGSWYWKGLIPRSGGYRRSVTHIYRTYVV
jgi:hypothetical protein